MRHFMDAVIESGISTLISVAKHFILRACTACSLGDTPYIQWLLPYPYRINAHSFLRMSISAYITILSMWPLCPSEISPKITKKKPSNERPAYMLCYAAA